MIVTAGKTNVSIFVYFVDDDGGTAPGEPTTGLLFSDIETGGSASYARQGGARVDFTLITLASASAVHADGGFILVDDTEMKGVYRLDIPDAAFITGVDQVVIQLRTAAAKNCIMHPVLVDITDVDLRDNVRAGLTSLPNAIPDSAGGLPISDIGGLDMDLIGTNTVATQALAAGTTGFVAINTDVELILADTDELQVDNVPGLIAALNDIAATDIVSAGAITTLTGAVVNVDLVDTLTTYTGNTKQTGDNFAIVNGAAGLVAINTDVELILADTNELQTNQGDWATAIGFATDIVCTETRLAELDPANLPTDIAAIDTAPMRGTNSALTDKAGFSLSTAGILAIWHQLTASIVTAGTAGKLIKDNLNTTVSSRMPTTHINATTGAVNNVTTTANLTTLPTIPANWLTATGIATDAISDVKISAAAGNKIADHVLRRTYANARVSSNGDAVNFRSLLGAVGKLVNRWFISGSTLSVTQEDDTTITAPGGTQTVTGTPSADPITEINTD
jgi:hypothetical protein